MYKLFNNKYRLYSITKGLKSRQAKKFAVKGYFVETEIYLLKRLKNASS